MLCPYCKTELEKREDGSYECPNCKTKIKPLASEQTAEKADDKSQGEANEVEQLKKRIATLEENSLQSKVKKAAGAATTYVKGNWKWLLPVVLAVLLFIILMVSFVGLRGIYVNVNDPNDFMDFGVSKYTAYSTDELGQAYVESGKYTLSGSKLTLKVKDSDFGDLKEEFAVRVSTGYNSLKLILDGDEVIEYKRVSIVGYKTTAEKVTVTFDPCNGQDPKKFKVKIGSSLGREIDAPANGSQRFLGWYNERNGSRSETAMAYKKDLRIWEDTTFYASWPFEVDENGVLYQVDKNGIGEELRIPANVRSIGENVFADCTQITSVFIPATVQEIQYNAFSGCTNIVSATAPGNLLSSFHYLQSAYVNGGSLTGSQSFSDSLKDLQISIYVTDIDLSNIRMNALERISVDFGNPNWTSNDGILYKASDKSIAYVPKAIKGAISILDGCTGIKGFSGHTGFSDITIPDSVVIIDNDAFYGCTGLQNVTIPESVTSIGNRAFQNCTKLQTVTIGAGVKSIGYSVFNGCKGITNVVVSSLKGWCEIEFGSDANPLYFADNAKLYVQENGEEKEVTGEVNIPVGTTKIGENTFYGLTGITSVMIPESVTAICSYAFSGCTGLQTVTIGSGVTSIGSSAFYGCTGITKIVVSSLKGWCEIEFGGSSANPLYYADNAKLYVKENGEEKEVAGEVNIPVGTTKIGDGAFYGLTGITSVTIPESVTSIGNSAFSGCTSLQTVTIPSSVTNIGTNAFYQTQFYNSLPNGVIYLSNIAYGYKGSISGIINIRPGTVHINKNAFSDCTGITQLTIPDSVQSIGDGAFSGCTRLQTVTIGEGVESIGNNAFSGCTGITKVSYLGDLKGWCEIEFEPSSYNDYESNPLYAASGNAKLYVKDNGEEKEVAEEVNIPVGTTKIGEAAFYKLKGITSVTIPSSVKSIGEYTFYECTGITRVNYLGDLKGWCEIEFEDYDSNPLNGGNAKLYVKENGAEKVVTGEVNIPVGTTKIGNYVFFGLTGITSVNISDNVTSIGDGAFVGTGLRKITIPDSVTSIGYGAFQECTDLQTVTIGSGVTSIGYAAFYYCTGLQVVTIGAGVTSIDDFAFCECKNLKDIYYAGSAEQWGQITKGDMWDEYSDEDYYYDYLTIHYQMHYNSTGPSAAASAEDAEYDGIERLFEEVEALRCTDEGKHAIAA